MILEQKGASRCYLLIHFTLKREENRNRGKRSRHNCKSLRGRLVVFPTASSSSVTSLTELSRPAISTIPLALSVIGPNESIDIMAPVKESSAIAAIAVL